MKLSKSERVQYEKNPLIEVLAQIRFPRKLEIEQKLPAEFQKKISGTFPFMETQSTTQISVSVNEDGKQSIKQIPSSFYNFLSLDKKNRITLASDYISFTTTDYTRWESFRPHLLEAFKFLQEIYDVNVCTRIGLRYKDLINRTELNLEGVSWLKLIKPQLTGVLNFSSLFEGQIIENDIPVCQSAYQFNLETCSAILQTGLIEIQGAKDKCFLIDTDFFILGTFEPKIEAIKTHLENLHENAGALFHHCIEEQLRAALKPKPVSAVTN